MRKVVPARKGETKESKEWNEKRKDTKKLIVQAEAETERLKEEIEDSQEEWKRIKMKTWQQNINTSIGDLSKWLKSRAEGPTPSIEKDGVTAKTRPEAIQMIKDHWQEVWNRYPDQEEKRKHRDGLQNL